MTSTRISIVLIAIFLQFFATKQVFALDTIKIQATYISPLKHGLIRVTRKTEKGYQDALMDSHGRFITQFKFNEIADFIDGIAIITLEENGYSKNGLMDTTGKILLYPIYDLVSEVVQENRRLVATFDTLSQQMKYGFTDAKGILKVPCQFKAAEPFSNGLSLVTTRMKKDTNELRSYFITPLGKQAFVGAWNYAQPFYDGLAGVQEFGKLGFVNDSGVYVIQPKYDWISPFRSGIATVYKDTAYFNIDKSGQILGQFKHKPFKILDNGLTFTTYKSLTGVDYFGLVDKNCVELIANDYESLQEFNLQNFSPTLLTANKQGVLGAINSKGETIIPFRYENLFPYEDGLWRAVGFNKIAVFTEQGEEIMNIDSVQEIGSFSGDWAPVTRFEYPSLLKNTSGAASQYGVGSDEDHIIRYNYTNKSGKILFSENVLAVTPFKNGFSFFLKMKKWGIINDLGKIILDPILDEKSEYHTKSLAVALHNKQYGLVDSIGKWHLLPSFAAIVPVSNTLYAIKNFENQWWLYDTIRGAIKN